MNTWVQICLICTVPLRASFAFYRDNKNAWFCSNITTYFLIFNKHFVEAVRLPSLFLVNVVFLKPLRTQKAAVISWETLSRSVMIDLGSKGLRNPGICELWASKYPIPGYCGKTAEMLWSKARLISLGEGQWSLWLTEGTITGRAKEASRANMMRIIKSWNRDVCFSTKCFASL